MTHLRDIRKKQDFQRFSLQLHRELRDNNCPILLQKLQHLIAKSLGARSLEAYNASQENSAGHQERTGEDMALQWFVIKNADSEFLRRSGGFSALVDFDIDVYNKQQADVVCARIGSGCSAICFSAEFPALTKAVFAPLSQLPLVSFDGFSPDAWRDEVEREDTSLSYAEWLQHQHEDWIHNVKQIVR